jgi:hypothetical protein
LLLLFSYHFITLKRLFGMSSSYGSWWGGNWVSM